MIIKSDFTKSINYKAISKEETCKKLTNNTFEIKQKIIDQLTESDEEINQDDIKSMKPDLEKLKKLNYPSVVITAKGDESDFVSRNFAPKLGIPEDPVTGSSHCELIPYWSKKPVSYTHLTLPTKA